MARSSTRRNKQNIPAGAPPDGDDNGNSPVGGSGGSRPRPPPQCRSASSSSSSDDQANGNPPRHPTRMNGGTTSTYDPIQSSSPRSSSSSTWPIFLLHFALPMALLILASNGNDIRDGLASLVGADVATRSSAVPSPVPASSSNGGGGSKPSALPAASSSSKSSSSKYRDEIDAAIGRKQQKETHSQSTSSRKQTANSNKRSEEKRPMSPQSSPLYHQMEATIQKLRTQYDQSHNTPEEYMAALRLADFLKYRDTTIHDGGTYQMEAIDVYTRAIELIETLWRQKMKRGEETRLYKQLADQEYASGGYTELNRELFLDNNEKSTEGLLCAALCGLGKVYFMSNMFERAVESYEECLSYDGSYLDALTYRAQALLILGKYAEAGRDYKRVLETDTERIFVDAVTGLARVLSAKEDAIPGGWDYLVQSLEIMMPRHQEVYDRIKGSDNASGIKHYADGLKRMHLAMFAYHDVKTKDAKEAWKHLSKGNELKLTTVAPFDAASEKERVSRVKQVFVPDFFPEGLGSKTRAPIFIIGFVRSGSTLLERILDAHPLIVGTGEDSVFNGRLDMIRNEIVKASMVGDPEVLQTRVEKLANDVVDDMRKRWEVIDANMHKEEDDSDGKQRPQPTRFADKMLTNYMNVGFIHMLFPNALILHVAREPMDTIFSAYKHDFPPGGLDYTSEFRGLAQLYKSYRDIMEHWDKVLPGRVTHVRYEDMVTDLPNVAPKIIEAVGVEWDPTVLDFHKKKQAVNTLSTTQVRKGLYSHHFKGWRRYEEFLGPLLKLVGRRKEYNMKTTLPGYVKKEADDA